MATSRFFRITDNLLLEYIYGEDGTDEIEVSESGFTKIQNAYTNDTNILVSPSSQEENLRNVIDNTSVLIDPVFKKWALLDQDVGESYDQADNNITTEDLTFPIDYPIVYDTVRVHFAAGYNLDDIDGFITDIKVTDRANRKHSLASITFRKTDEWNIINPAEFLLGETLFSTYIEFKIPSLYYLLVDQNTNYPSDSDYLSVQFTDGVKLNPSSEIDIEVNLIYKSERDKVTNHTFLFVSETVELSVPKQDDFAQVTANIEESNDGDFFELSAKFQGNNIENYISQLNTLPESDWVIIHNIEVYEDLGGSEIRPTYPYTLIQDEEFERSIVFRPVILNTNIALRYRMVYSIRIFNRITNESVVKISQRIFDNPRKYGRKLDKINLGISPVQENIYNYVLDNKYEPVKIERNETAVTRYVPIFIEKNNVVSNFSTARVNTETGFVSESSIDINSSETFRQQGELTFNIAPIDSFYLFRIYSEDNDKYTPVDLTTVDTLNINFINNAGDRFRIPYFPDTEADLKSGRVLFRIDDSKAKKILSFENRSFFITAETGAGDETILFSGEYRTNTEFNQQRVAQENIRLENRNESLERIENRFRDSLNRIIESGRSARQDIQQLSIKRRELVGQISSLNAVIDNLKRTRRLISQQRQSGTVDTRVIQNNIDRTINSINNAAAQNNIEELIKKIRDSE